MNWRHRSVDLGLFVCALGLAGYLGATAGNPTTGELEARRNNLLPSFQEESIQSIRLSAGDLAHETVLRRDPEGDLDHYFLGKAGTEAADPSQVAEMLRALSQTTFLRSWNEAESPKDDLGFSSPRVELRVMAGVRSFRVLIGKDAEVPKGSVYVQVSGTNVGSRSGVVSRNFLDDLSKSSQEFRAGLLFPYSKTRTSRLSIQGKQGANSFLADGLGFLLEGKDDKPLRCDRTVSDLIFFHLGRAKMEHFLDPKVVQSSQNEPDAEVFRVRMESPDGPRVEVSLGGQCPDQETLTLGIRRTPDEVAGCVPRGVLAALQLSDDRLVSQSVLPLHADEVDHIILERKGRRLDLIREGAEFYLNAKERTKVPKEAAAEFLAAFTDGTFELIPEPRTELRTIGSITFKGQSATTYDPQRPDSEKLEAVREISVDLFGNSTDGTEVIRRRDDGAWLKAPPSLEWALSGDDSWARKRALSTWQPLDISEVWITMDGTETRLTRSSENFFIKEESALLPADQLLSRELLDELSHLEARRYLVPPQSRPTTDLLKIRFRIHKEGETQSHLETLYIGERTRGGYLAWASFAEGTFVLPAESRIVLETPLWDRSPVVLDPQTFQSFSITFDGRSYGFKRTNGSLIPQSGSASFDMVEPLVEALSGLQIVSALAKQASRKTTPYHPTVTLTGERMNQAGSLDPFALHFGKEISVQGRTLQSVWREGAPRIFLVTQASFQELIELL